MAMSPMRSPHLRLSAKLAEQGLESQAGREPNWRRLGFHHDCDPGQHRSWRRRFQFMLRSVVITSAVAAAPAIAQDWPTRPVTMVVTFAPGTAGDIVGRILSAPLGETLGQPVIIDNVPGGGGLTGSNRVAKAAPDGYQFLVGTVGTHAIA